MRIVFLGTPAFAVPSLRALVADGHDLVAVVTQPDRPRGRGQRLQPTDVKAAAMALGLPVLQPSTLRDPEWVGALSVLAPDLGVVVAYGQILPAAVLDVPRLGFINVHASLLPRWRGAAPVHRAVLAGDHVTGVTIIRVVPALDAGPVISARTTPIDPDETSDAIERRLAALGATLLTEAVRALAHGPVVETPQDETRVTYAPRLSRADGFVSWDRPALEIHNQIRGLHPWPLASTWWRGRRVILHAASPDPGTVSDAAPGTVLRADRKAIHVAARPGVVCLFRLQLEGRPVLSVEAFLNGHPMAPGDRFDPAPIAP